MYFSFRCNPIHTAQDYFKAHRKASREEEIAHHGKPVGPCRYVATESAEFPDSGPTSSH